MDFRDDLVVELVTLYNQTDESKKALQLLSDRRFHPWEGGEGLVSGQYVGAHLLLGRQALKTGNAREALKHFDAARNYPENLGEAKHLLTLETHLDYFSGLALQELGRDKEAREYWHKAAQTETGNSDMTFYKALALRELENDSQAVLLLNDLLEFTSRQIHTTPKIDYFATSLPNFLLFDDDLTKRNQIHCRYLAGLAKLGLGRTEEAVADLREVLALDINHLSAQTELESLAPAQVAGTTIMTHYVSGDSTARTTAAIERPTVHFNSLYLWTISLVAALGGLLFGYDWVVIGGAKPFYEQYFHLNNASQQGWAVSCALIGCLFGAMISGALCDKYGRKLLLLLSALLFAVSSLAIAMTNVFHTFVAWRIAGGIAIGLASNLSPCISRRSRPRRYEASWFR